MGIGVYNYLVEIGDKEAFKAWLNWIKHNPHTYSPLPSYCPHKECVFKAIDCPILITVASRFDMALEALDVCNPLDGLGLPGPEELAKQFQNSVDNLLDAEKRYDDLHRDLIDKIGSAIPFDGAYCSEVPQVHLNETINWMEKNYL